MRQRHPRAPAIRAEGTRGIGADEFEQFERHGGFRHCEGSDAIQSTAAETFWIASLALAMTLWR
jgi:hypothetical protein